MSKQQQIVVFDIFYTLSLHLSLPKIITPVKHSEFTATAVASSCPMSKVLVSSINSVNVDNAFHNTYMGRNEKPTNVQSGGKYGNVFSRWDLMVLFPFCHVCAAQREREWNNE